MFIGAFLAEIGRKTTHPLFVDLFKNQAKNMGTQSIILSKEDRWETVWQALQAAQQLQKDRLTFGIDHVNMYVEDVDGDWLERWGEDEEESDRELVRNC